LKLHPLRTFLAWIVIIYVVCVAIVSSVKAKNYPVAQQIFIPERPSTTTSTGIKRTELERRKIAGTEQEMRLYLIVYPPGVAAPVHHHPTVGMGYILEGTFESAFGSDKPRIYHAGQSFQDLAIVPHTIFRNVDKHKPLKFLAYYIVKSGKPVIVTP
jgi:quercetin dioxygenase-like cupin family protein